MPGLLENHHQHHHQVSLCRGCWKIIINIIIRYLYAGVVGLLLLAVGAFFYERRQTQPTEDVDEQPVQAEEDWQNTLRY
jgi:hypothetical protein